MKRRDYVAEILNKQELIIEPQDRPKLTPTNWIYSFAGDKCTQWERIRSPARAVRPLVPEHAFLEP